MVAPTLQDYEYQFKDTGVLLNGSTTPFWDVEKITGLADLPEMDAKVLDYDGKHGSSVYTKYVKHRVIVIDGTLYTSATNFDAPLLTMRTSVIPDGVDYPFYYKHPNLSQRYHMVKPVAFNCDVDTMRRIGAGKFQLQLIAGDPRAFVDASVNWTNNVNFNLNNGGNVNTGPLVTISATSTTTANITVQNNDTARAISFSTAVTTGNVITIDLDALAVKVNGAYRPVAITLSGSDWPEARAGFTDSWKVTSNVGNGTITNKSAWL